MREIKMNLSSEIIKKLIASALKAREQSYNPYSKFAVGAAILTDDNNIITGTNIENISFGLTMCAERVALFKAISDGYKKFKALAVVSKDAGTPCGACRQVIWELAGNIPIIIADLNSTYTVSDAKDLLPKPFETHVAS